MGKWNKWAINVVKDLPTFADGRVALLGDAVTTYSCASMCGC